MVLENLWQIKKFITLCSQTCWGKFYNASMIKDNEIKFTPKCYHEEIPFNFPAIALSKKIIISKESVYIHNYNKRSASYNSDYGMLSGAHALDAAKTALHLINWFIGRPKLYEMFKEEIEYRFILLTLHNLFSDNQVTKQLQKMINTYFPGWRNNPYLKNSIHGEKIEAIMDSLN